MLLGTAGVFGGKGRVVAGEREREREREREGGDGVVNMHDDVEWSRVELETTLSHTSSNVVIIYRELHVHTLCAKVMLLIAIYNQDL